MNRGKWLLIVLILGVVSLVGTPAWSNKESLQKAKELNQEFIRLYLHARPIHGGYPLSRKNSCNL